MEKSIANEAMREQREVKYKGRRFKRINAIIARRFTGGNTKTYGELIGGTYNTQIQLELYEERTNSVTVASIEDVELVDEEVV